MVVKCNNDTLCWSLHHLPFTDNKTFDIWILIDTDLNILNFEMSVKISDLIN